MRMNVSKFYKQILGISEPGLLQRLVSVTELRRLSKKEIFIKEGQPLTHVAFVISGIFRGGVLDASGRDITDCFAFRYGDPAMAGFDLDAPCAIVTIEALTDGELLCIPIETVKTLLKENIFLIQIYNKLLADAMEKHWEIKNILHKQMARERYQWFLTAYPGLIDKVTHRYIASFLEMSPVTLSRLRSEEWRRDKIEQKAVCLIRGGYTDEYIDSDSRFE